MLKRVLSLSTVTFSTWSFIRSSSTSFNYNLAMSDNTKAEIVAPKPNIAHETCGSHSPNLTDKAVTEQAKTSTSENPGQLSKRALKRLERKKVIEEKKKQKKAKKKSQEESDKITQEQIQETDYYFENGLRKVYPYHYIFHTFSKGRWVGQKLVDIFAREFRNDTEDAYKKAIEEGLVSVNGQTIDLEYVVKDNDYIENRVHRHELPVTGEEINIIQDDEEVLVVNKPSSIPIHPCGRYRHNSLIYILAKERNLFNLRTFYRIDRLTSGLMIFPKTEKKTAEMVDVVLKRKVEKTYLCKVDGEFPETTVVCEEPLGQLDVQLGLHKVDKNGKLSKTTFERLSYDSSNNTSIVKCLPHTGRTHQIRVHLQWLGFPITNDPLYNSHVWGPNRGKNGDFGKPNDQLIVDLKAHHSIENLKLPPDVDSSQLSSEEDDCKKSCNSQEHESPAKRLKLDEAAINQREPRFDPSKLTIDQGCNMCKCKFPDPPPEKLVMYLHALSYKSEDWEYSTPVPGWAKT